VRIYVGNNGDTLQKIAYHRRLEIAELLSLNLHIADPYESIAGKQVRLPSRGISTIDQTDMPLATGKPTLGSRDMPPACPPVPPLNYMDYWIPTVSLEQMEKTDYDVLIVGTGAGGGAVLWRLCEQWRANGKRIGIIEAGNFLLPTHAQNVPTLNQERFDRMFLNPKLLVPIGKRLPQFPGATDFNVLGGRTLFWTLVTPRIFAPEIAKWPITMKEMDRYYNIAERVMNVTSEYTKGSSITDNLLARLHAYGVPEAAPFPMAVDLEPTKYGIVHSNVFFSSMNFFAYALNHRPFDLAVQARAVKVVAQNGKIAGVEVMSPDKKSYFLKSKIVVMSTSAFETPRLLLHSGIQERALGHYLSNSSYISALGKLNRVDFPEVLGTLAILIPQTEEHPFQYQIFGPKNYLWYHNEEMPLRSEWDIRYQGFGSVEPRFENQLYLDPNARDEYGVPLIQINFSYSDKDKEIIQQMTEQMKRVSQIIRAPLISPDGGPAICLNPPGIDYHVVGTCRMGDDPYHATTNRFGEVFSVSGLFVADNSVMPSIGAVNPTLSMVAFAIRTADYIIHQLK
jgi:choline dehydrogenase-like flavoprotein